MGFREDLLSIWDLAHEVQDEIPCSDEEFSVWSGATKDMLSSMGLTWDVEVEEYVFQNPKGQPCVKCGKINDWLELTEVVALCSLCGATKETT